MAHHGLRRARLTLRQSEPDVADPMPAAPQHAPGRLRRIWAVGLRFAPVFGIRAGDVAVRFAFNLTLARALGADASGVYYLALSIVTLASSLARLGLDTAAVKYLAIAADRSDHAQVRGIAARVLAYVAAASLALSALLWFGAGALASHLFAKPALAPVLQALSLATCMLSLDAALAALLSALGRPALSQLIGTVLWPALMLPVLIVAAPGNPADVAHLAVVAMAVTAIVGAAALLKAGGRGPVALGAVPLRTIAATGLPLFGAEMVFLLFSNLPVVALGYFASAAEVGQFAVASRISLLMAVFVVAAGVVASPGFARFHAAQQRDHLTAHVFETTRLVGALAAIACLVMIAVPGLLLQLFGAGFGPAAPMLVILALGQLVPSLFATASSLLSMTGGETALWRATLVSFVAMAILLVALVPQYGGLGAAIATAAGTACYGIAAAIAVRRRLGIDMLHAYWPIRPR